MRPYLRRIHTSYSNGVATELTYCQHLGDLFSRELNHDVNNCQNLIIEAQPSQNGRFPDFIVVNEHYQTVVRIEAKLPTESLDQIVENNRDQLIRYLDERIGHPNLIITNFLSFSSVTLQDGEPVLSGDIYDLLPLQNLQENVPDQSVNDSRDRFRQLIQYIANLQPVEINSANKVQNSLTHLCHAVMDWYHVPDFNVLPPHERVIRETFESLTKYTIGMQANQNDLGKTFGQLIAVGYCMNEFLRQRQQIPFEDWGFSPEIFTNPSLSTLMTIVHAHRKLIGIEQLDLQVRRGLSLHMGEISQEDDQLVENMRTFEQFLHGYLSLEDEDWVNNYGLVPTPSQVVTYMVRKAEAEWVNIDPDNRQDGYLSEDCSVLDPCTGSGHYYIEVLTTIHQNALARGFGSEWATERVRRAIGTDEQIGRVHAFDIQPMCVIITEMQLRLFCENLGWESTRGLRPQIFMQDGLEFYDNPQTKLHIYSGNRIRRRAATNPESPISITVGNPPWSSYIHAVAITQEIKDRMSIWTRPFTDWYNININSQGKTVNPEIAYAFFFKYLTSNSHELVSFIAPDTITSSSGWLGFRRWSVENGLYLRMDNLGGSSGIIQRPDGNPVFVENGRARTTAASTIFTMHLQGEAGDANPCIRARDCWDDSEGVRWHTEQKLGAILDEAENIHQDLEYNLDYSSFIPPTSKWRPMSLTNDSPLLPEVSRFDQNYSGMEAQNGGHRMINSNRGHLLSLLQEIFGNDSIDNAGVNQQNRWYLEHIVGNEDQRVIRFNWLRERVLQFPDFFREITLAPMCNFHAFVPTDVDEESGKDQLKLWKVPRVHETELPEDDDNLIARGYLSAIQRISTGTELGLGPGFSVSHNMYYPGHKDTANTNGRSFPRSIFTDEGWVPNISTRFLAFINQNELNLGDNIAEKVWDYVLCVLSSNQVLLYSKNPVECYDLPVCVTNDNDLWNRVSDTGATIRILQELIETLPQANIFYELHQLVISLIDGALSRNIGPERTENAPGAGFILNDLKQDTNYKSKNWNPTQNETSVFESEDLSNLVEEVCNTIQDISVEWDLEYEDDHTRTVFENSFSIRLDHPNDIWLSGIPSIVTEFKLAGHVVLKKWLAYNSNLSDANQFLHSVWDDQIRNQKWQQLVILIRNITTMSLIQPIINQLYQRVQNSSQSWNDFLSPPEED